MLGGSNAPSPSGGFKNLYSLAFDGVNDFVTCGDADVFTPNTSGANRGFSLGLWFKTTDASVAGPPPPFGAGSSKFLLGKNNTSLKEYDLQVESNGKISMKFYSQGGGLGQGFGELTTSLALNTGDWTHILYTWDLSNDFSGFKVYVNGTEDASATITAIGSFTGVANKGAALQFAQIEGGVGISNLAASLDEIFIVDDNLSASQAADIYNSATPIDMNTINHLVAWWRNGDTEGPSVFPTITDDSSNSNDGTMTNMDSGDIVTDVP